MDYEAFQAAYKYTAELSDVRLQNLTSFSSKEEEEDDDKRGANQKEFVGTVVNIEWIVRFWNHKIFWRQATI